MSTVTRRTLLQLLGLGSGAAVLPRAARTTWPVDDTTDREERSTVRSQPARLESFIKRRGIKPAYLARESGYARAHLLQLRFGGLLPSLACIAALTLAARRLTHDHITPTDLFPQDVIATARASCNRRALEAYERAEIIAAFAGTREAA